MGQTIQQYFELDITADDSELNPDGLQFDVRSAKILAFGIFSKRMDQVDLRGSFKMMISGKEIFPEGTDTKQFTTNANVPVMQKLYYFKEPIEPGNRELKIQYNTDANDLLAFAAHSVKFTFLLELKD